jgi:lipopolysaccharide heptosyltransferase II
MYCQQKLLKFIDLITGKLLTRLLTRPTGRLMDLPPERIILIRPGGIGDAVLLAPAINFLKKIYPDCHITILAEQRNAGIYSLVPGVAKVLCYDRLHEFIQALLGRYDIVIDTEQWFRLSAVVARLVRAPMKIGFDTNVRRRMFTHSIGYDMNAYELDNFISLLEPLGANCRRDVDTVSLSLPPQSMTKARNLLQKFGTDSFVVISAGASIPEKRWGAERFSLVAKRLTEDGYRVAVVGGDDDRADGDVIAGGGGLNLSGMTTLAETAAVIARSSLVISGDSGVLHIAAGLNIPTVSLFGPSCAAKWAPQGKIHVVLSHNLPCSPCSRFGTIPPCPIDARCIREISPDEVMAATLRLLPHLHPKN